MSFKRAFFLITSAAYFWDAAKILNLKICQLDVKIGMR